MHIMRYARKRLGGYGTIGKMLLLGVVAFGIFQICQPAPPRDTRHLPGPPKAAGNNELGGAAVNSRPLRFRKTTRANRKPGSFYRNVIVHFDLKGAPPRVPYFLQLLTLAANSGATGVLLEWEDMFPYTGELEIARSSDAYSIEDVRTILEHCKSLGLDVIPLVQTFGHLEWILKLEQFRPYRENDASPQVICLGDPKAAALIKDAISQVMKAHADIGIPFFHIGADEAFEYGDCKAARAWLTQHSASREELALTHLRDIAEHVMATSPSTVVLAWNDMLKTFPPSVIADLRLGDLVEPVVWDYSEGIVTLNDQQWDALAANFPTAWASSAFKGANFPSAQYIDIRHYETNNRAWIEVKKQQESKFKDGIRGIIITGWQRYDHMTALCETLPVGTPSMVLNIETALAGGKMEQETIRRRAAAKLNCTSFSVGNLNVISTRCGFPGFQAYLTFQQSVRSTVEYIEAELAKDHQLLGWMSPYSRAHSYGQNWYLRQIEPKLAGFSASLQRTISELRSSLKTLFFENTIDEMVFLSIGQLDARIQGMLDDLREMSKKRSWPSRHFSIKKPKGDL